MRGYIIIFLYILKMGITMWLLLDFVIEKWLLLSFLRFQTDTPPSEHLVARKQFNKQEQLTFKVMHIGRILIITAFLVATFTKYVVDTQRPDSGKYGP